MALAALRQAFSSSRVASDSNLDRYWPKIMSNTSFHVTEAVKKELPVAAAAQIESFVNNHPGTADQLVSVAGILAERIHAEYLPQGFEQLWSSGKANIGDVRSVILAHMTLEMVKVEGVLDQYKREVFAPGKEQRTSIIETAVSDLTKRIVASLSVDSERRMFEFSLQFAFLKELPTIDADTAWMESDLGIAPAELLKRIDIEKLAIVERYVNLVKRGELKGSIGATFAGQGVNLSLDVQTKSALERLAEKQAVKVLRHFFDKGPVSLQRGKFAPSREDVLAQGFLDRSPDKVLVYNKRANTLELYVVVVKHTDEPIGALLFVNSYGYKDRCLEDMKKNRRVQKRRFKIVDGALGAAEKKLASSTVGDNNFSVIMQGDTIIEQKLSEILDKLQQRGGLWTAVKNGREPTARDPAVGFRAATLDVVAAGLTVWYGIKGGKQAVWVVDKNNDVSPGKPLQIGHVSSRNQTADFKALDGDRVTVYAGENGWIWEIEALWG